MALKNKTRWGRSPAGPSSPGPHLGPPSVPAARSGPDRPAPAQALRHRFAVERTRTGGWWVTLVAAAVVLLLLLIFMLQNGARVAVSLLGAHATLPLGIALLLAAIAGVLIVAIPGTGRILQLRHLARQQARRPEPDRSGQPEEQQADAATTGQTADGVRASTDSRTAQQPGQPAP